MESNKNVNRNKWIAFETIIVTFDDICFFFYFYFVLFKYFILFIVFLIHPVFCVLSSSDTDVKVSGQILLQSC